MRRFIVLLFTVALPGMALAQAPAPPDEPETITSEAQRQKDELLSRKFVQSILRPSTSLEGQFAKWKTPVCPHVYGLLPASAQFVERRIRDVAAQIGAPVDHVDPCVSGIGIIFTAQPQASLESIAAARPFLLLGNDQKLVVRYPVQAWYATLRTDYGGFKTIDIPFEITEAWRDCNPGLAGCPQSRANDTKLHTGHTVEIAAATVLVDTRAVTGMPLGSVADYLALLTLAQAPVTGRCQPAPSIANLFLKDCEADFHVDGLSDADLAMLTALYQTPDEPEKLQMQRIVGNMHRKLEGQGK